MATRSFERVHCFPIVLCILMIAGVLAVAITASLKKDVTPYVPFISEAGAKPPESGIFSIVLYFSSVFGIALIVVRYMVVEECHQGLNKVIGIFNKLALLIGILSMMGMVVVAAYPMITILLAHTIGAFALFLGCLMYGALHSVISYLLRPSHNSNLVFGLRVAIVILSLIAFVVMSTTAPKGLKQFQAANYTHWSGSKTPGDVGFEFILIGAAAEWAMFLLFLGFFLTYIEEFRNASLHIGVQLMVAHFDDNSGSRRYTGSL